MARFGLLKPDDIDTLMTRVRIVPEADAGAALSAAAIIFEGVPEVLDLKRDALARCSRLAGPTPISAARTTPAEITSAPRAIPGRRRMTTVTESQT